MKKFLTVFLLCMFILGAMAAYADQSMVEDQSNQMIAKARNAMVDQLEGLSMEMTAAAKVMAIDVGNQTAGLRILNALSDKIPGVVSCSVIDQTGFSFLIFPQEYNYLKGRNMANYAHYLKVQESKKPVTSRYFLAEEGVLALEVLQPVLDENGKLIGVISVIFDPGAFLAQALKPLKLNPDKIAVSVTQTDGWILYSPLPSLTGMNYFRIPRYQKNKELMALGHKICAEPMGTADYSAPYNDKTYQLHGEWSTITLFGTNWRLLTEKVLKINK